MSADTDVQMAKWTGSLALLLGLAAAGFLLQPPSKFSSPAPSASETFSSSSAQGERGFSSQAPATRAPQSAGATAAFARATTAEIRVSCGGPSAARVPASVREARLAGSFCTQNGATVPPRSDIRNAANGFSATAFYPSPRQFMTDYISLSPGANKILITHSWENGPVEKAEFLVERGP